MGSKTNKNSLSSKNERAASLVEYALLVALISIVCIAAIESFTTQVNENFSILGSTVTHPEIHL